MAARGKGKRQRARVRTRVTPRVKPVTPLADPAADLDAMLAQDAGPGVIQVLRTIAEDNQAGAAARASAARTLAEIEGRIGRHAPAPERRTTDVAVLSRDELVRELERLRASVGSGSV